MDKQRIEIGDCPLLPVIGRERIVPVVGVIESRVEAAEEGSHGQVDAPVAVINGRVDEHGLVFVIAEEVAGRRRAAPAEGQTFDVCRRRVFSQRTRSRQTPSPWRRAGGSGGKIAGSCR